MTPVQLFEQLSPDEIAAMPVDRLALMVLAHADATQTWNWRNWIIGWKQRTRLSDNTPATLAIAEAWGWLLAHGMVGPGPNHDYGYQGFNVTRAGRAALERGLEYVKATIRLDVELTPVLENKVRPQFVLGDFELAALSAMREVEIAVRSKAQLGTDLVGVKLMRAAFGEQKPLWSPDLDPGESVAQMDLFAGAIGLFKNPPSHRRVDYSDPTEAAEVVLLADLLIRLLARLD